MNSKFYLHGSEHFANTVAGDPNTGQVQKLNEWLDHYIYGHQFVQKLKGSGIQMSRVRIPT
jgi:hypothetical protein